MEPKWYEQTKSLHIVMDCINLNEHLPLSMYVCRAGILKYPFSSCAQNRLDIYNLEAWGGT